MSRPILLTLLTLLLAGVSSAQDAPKPASPPTNPAVSGTGDQPDPAKPAPPTTNPADAPAPPGRPAPSPDPEGLIRLSRDHDIWIDAKRKVVIVDGTICLREGALEMFACPRGTKEHESIVALHAKAWHVHAALLAVGATAGKPVSFDPTYRPATGSEIEVLIEWTDAEGKPHKARAQEWIKNAETGKELTHPWVFGGSTFWKDPTTGKDLYLAEDGDLICVSNFTTATLDLPIKSTADAAGLVFSAFTDRIPPLQTKVRLTLRPVPAK